MAKTVYYASIGPELTLFDMDVDGAALTKRGSLTLPANIQYAWPHPSRRYLYVVSSNGGPGLAGDRHFANALVIDPASGALRPHGAPVAQPEKPDTGIYAHQVLTTPANRTVLLVTRGNNLRAGKPEDPGAI